MRIQISHQNVFLDSSLVIVRSGAGEWILNPNVLAEARKKLSDVVLCEVVGAGFDTRSSQVELPTRDPKVASVPSPEDPTVPVGSTPEGPGEGGNLSGVTRFLSRRVRTAPS